MLTFTDVTRRFGDVTAVDNVSLRIDDGDMIGVIGRSGAGKSTLLRLINRLCEPDSGDIQWNGQSILKLKGKALRQWRSRATIIFQQFNLIPRLDVLTNVLLGAVASRPVIASMFKYFPAHARARAVMELDRLGMAEAAFKRTQFLSGGQQQRVAIARAMQQDPQILLADEPVASLDPVNAEIVMQSLRDINAERGITVIVNLHSLDIARRYCRRVIGMAQGKIVFDGPVAALTEGVIAQIYGAAPIVDALDAPEPLRAVS
ncbi:MAG: phosphonate ABC transporter ATP-binding protein [Sphingomonas sp.]